MQVNANMNVHSLYANVHSPAVSAADPDHDHDNGMTNDGDQDDTAAKQSAQRQNTLQQQKLAQPHLGKSVNLYA